MKLHKYAIVLTLSMLGTWIGEPAHADGFAASLSKESGISRVGEIVTLNISGVPSGQGVYILQCATPTNAAERPTACVGQSKTIWASSATSPGAQQLNPSMNISIDREISSAGNTIDCAISSCGVFIRRDHNGPTDKSLDLFLPFSFAPEYGVTVSKSQAIAFSGENLKISVLGLTDSQGVYVRLCQSAALGVRPTVCDGMGVWASLSPTQQAFGAVNALGELTLPVKSTFSSGGNTVDCVQTSCVLFVRRDHTGGSDLSLDRVIPLTFTTPPAAELSAKVSKTGGYFVFVIKNAKAKSIKVTAGSTVRTIKPTSDNYTYKVPVGKNKGRITSLRVTFGTNVLAKAILKG